MQLKTEISFKEITGFVKQKENQERITIMRRNGVQDAKFVNILQNMLASLAQFYYYCRIQPILVSWQRIRFFHVFSLIITLPIWNSIADEIQFTNIQFFTLCNEIFHVWKFEIDLNWTVNEQLRDLLQWMIWL